MISVTELRNNTTFKLDGQMYLVLKYEHTKKGRGSGNIKVKVKNLETGSITEKTFITGARVEPLETQTREANFLYQSGNQLVFMNNKTYEQFELDKDLVGEQSRFLQEGTLVKVLYTIDKQEKAVSIDIPPKITFLVAEADPGVKGDSAANMLKKVKLENGLVIKAPLFIKAGEKIIVDTRTGEYVERSK